MDKELIFGVPNTYLKKNIPKYSVGTSLKIRLNHKNRRIGPQLRLIF